MVAQKYNLVHKILAVTDPSRSKKFLLELVNICKASIKIARAKNSGGAAGGHIRQAQCEGAAPEQARPKAELTH